MTTWHWVRHGPTHEKTFVGWRDVPADLSDTDHLARLSDHLPKKAIMISSDLIRCIATADALRLPTRKRLPHDADLRELDFGVWDGMHFTEVAERDPILSREYWEKPGDVCAPDGESWNIAAARIARAVDRINHAHPHEDVIAVGHFGVILTQVQRAQSVTAYEVMAHKIDNLSVTEISHTSGKWSVAAINHLP
jgi:broad specificity phosphatase PhoE